MILEEACRKLLLHSCILQEEGEENVSDQEGVVLVELQGPV